MKISEMLMGILVFSGVITGAGLFAISVFTEHDSSAISQVKTLDYTNTLTNSYGYNIESKVKGQGTETVSTAEVVLTGGVTALLSIIALPGTIIGIVTDIGGLTNNVFQIPIWVIAMVTSIVVIFIIYKVLGIVTKAPEGI